MNWLHLAAIAVLTSWGLTLGAFYLVWKAVFLVAAAF